MSARVEKNAVLGGVEATMAIVRVAFIRMLRGRSLWVVAGMSLLPLAFAALLRDKESSVDHWRSVISFWAYFQAILPPVLLGSAIGEEIEEKTMTYLWSRPLPRWSIIAGKLVALVPVLWVILSISVILPFYATVPDAGAHTDLLYRSIGSVVLGTTAAAAITTGIATLAPRAGTVLALGYLVFIDRTFAWWELSVSKLSITYHSLRLSGVFGEVESVPVAMLWLTGISLFWLGIAAFQVRRIE
jgi:ABC-type transport system involved in multi-copper enzyme maturation permease subunit